MHPAAGVEQAKALLKERATLLQSPEYNPNSDVVCAIDSQVCKDYRASSRLAESQCKTMIAVMYISNAWHAPLILGMCSTRPQVLECDQNLSLCTHHAARYAGMTGQPYCLKDFIGGS